MTWLGHGRSRRRPLVPFADSKAWLLPCRQTVVSHREAHHRAEWALRILHAAVPVLTVLAYTCCPLAVSWAKIVDVESGTQGPLFVKGRPFKEASVVVVSWALVSLTGLLLSACLGGRRAVLRCFDIGDAARIAPAGAGWALADICEVLAVSRLDPAMYAVISQARLLACAGACRIMRGMRQSCEQMRILFLLSVFCAVYCLCPNDGQTCEKQEGGACRMRSGKDHIVGIVLALSKVCLSVLSGVYGEHCFKEQQGSTSPVAASQEIHIQMTQASISSMAAAYLGYLFICWNQGDDPADFFGGPDGMWDSRTFLVAAALCFREWICNLCVKQFDSLVKNICNAVALVATYALAVAVTGDATFSFLKVSMLFAAVAMVCKYVTTRSKESVLLARPGHAGAVLVKVSSGTKSAKAMVQV
mmetsp:Transcript_36076/g.103748  ORF Transcript_36076/g.103748 Transcript_36076/m.103748 type:complete len:417 (+) Transcript_36076:59-1309(+)